jgi:hypothetical protein
MATKNKTKKKSSKSKRTARKQSTPALKKKAVKRPKKLARKESAPKSAKKGKVPARKQTRQGREGAGSQEFSVNSPGSQSGGQSGDLQGLSRREGADSESVRELLEEGNAFEADIVAGVESGGDGDPKEVRTHEVPEDDVPGEYRDKD